MMSIISSIGKFYNIFVVVFFLGLVGSPILKLIGLTITGFDYLIIVAYTLVLFLKKSRSFYLSKKHFLIFFLLLLVIFLNFKSNYVVFKWGIIGSFLIILPHLVFILSRNINLSTCQLNSIVKKILAGIDVILIITIIETLFFKSGKGTYSIFLLKTPAFAVTLANLSVILRLYFMQKNKVNKQSNFLKIILTCFFIIFSIQFKSILSLLLILVVFFGNNFKRLLYLSLVLIIGVRLLFFIPSIKEKADKYVRLYAISNISEMSEGPPRTILYFTSFVLANDFFPLGTGPGTFGSYPVNINYSNVYYDYGLNYIHGIDPEATAGGSNPDKYLLDTYWSSVLGELGFFGFILVFFLYTYPIVIVLKKDVNNNKIFDNTDIKIIFAIILFLSFESIALSLLTQSSFILIMTGLTGMIIKRNG